MNKNKNDKKKKSYNCKITMKYLGSQFKKVNNKNMCISWQISMPNMCVGLQKPNVWYNRSFSVTGT